VWTRVPPEHDSDGSAAWLNGSATPDDQHRSGPSWRNNPPNVPQTPPAATAESRRLPAEESRRLRRPEADAAATGSSAWDGLGSWNPTRTPEPAREPARQDLARQDLARQDLSRPDLSRRDPARQDPARQDTARPEPARPEARPEGHEPSLTDTQTRSVAELLAAYGTGQPTGRRRRRAADDDD
jgi:hypothetical protein